MVTTQVDYRAGSLRVAVVGGGVSGIVAAHCISRSNHVVLFEREQRLGGHTYTVTVDRGPDAAPLPVDMGFIVCNKPNYPIFLRFLEALGVELAESDMSFAFHDPETGLMYAGTGLPGMLARPANLVTPAFWRMLLGIWRFCREAKPDLAAGAMEGMTIGQYLEQRGYSPDFENNYLLPMAGAIWSAPGGRARDFPAEALVRFFDNHALLDLAHRPPWFYVKGGSSSYVQAFAGAFPGEVRTETPVTAVTRDDNGVTVAWEGGSERFDAVVMATHADITRRLLADPDPEEERLLAPWSYAPNRVVLHTDTTFLPPTARGRASWNFIKDPNRPEDAPVGVSYHMNRLQRIRTPHDYVVTLNPVRSPSRGGCIEDVTFDHPQYSVESMDTQAGLQGLNGRNRTFFCGAYLGYGFHEDGARSGSAVGAHFGETL